MSINNIQHNEITFILRLGAADRLTSEDFTHVYKFEFVSVALL